MVLNRDQFHYPDSPDDFREDEKFAFGKVHEVYGTQRLTNLFGPSATTPAPWPRVAKTKQGLPIDRERVRQVLSQPPELHDFDPRNLHSTQPSVLRAHAAFYMDSSYEDTGQTSADQDNVGNRFPVVYRDRRGRNIILSGHHRATAALLRGEPLRAREVTED